MAFAPAVVCPALRFMAFAPAVVYPPLSFMAFAPAAVCPPLKFMAIAPAAVEYGEYQVPLLTPADFLYRYYALA